MANSTSGDRLLVGSDDNPRTENNDVGPLRFNVSNNASVENLNLVVTTRPHAGGSVAQNTSGDIRVDTGPSTVVNVSLTPVSQSAAAGTQTTYEVTVEGVNNGVGSYDFNVSVSNVAVANITGAEPQGNPDTVTTLFAPDNSSVRVNASGTNLPDTGPVVIGTITVTARTPGTTNLILSGANITDETSPSHTYLINTVQQATISVGDTDSTPTPTPTSTPTPTPTATATSTLTATTTSTATPTPTPTSITQTSPTDSPPPTPSVTARDNGISALTPVDTGGGVGPVGWALGGLGIALLGGGGLYYLLLVRGI